MENIVESTKSITLSFKTTAEEKTALQQIANDRNISRSELIASLVYAYKNNYDFISAKNTIKKFRPNLCVSAYHKPYHIFQIQNLLESWDLDYKFYLRVHEHNTFGTVLYCLQDNLLVS